MPSKVRIKAFPLRHSQWPNSHDLRQPPSRMVAAINICICDLDGRRPSSTPAHFEAPDALGSGEQGGRILMPAEFQFRALVVSCETT